MRILQRKSVERGAVGKREETKKVNSSAFNDIIRAYCKLALNDAGVDEKMADAVILSTLFRKINHVALHL